VVFPTRAVAEASLDIPDPSIENYPHSSGRVRVHTVRRGETMRSIALRYNTSTERLMKINGLRKPRIFPGQTLLLTRASSSSRSSKSSKSSKAAASKASKAGKTSKKRSGASSKASARTK
jgi:LysM repeat protein